MNYYLTDEKADRIEVKTKTIKWSALSPYRFSNPAICPINDPSKCRRSHCSPKKPECLSSHLYHFCKHPVHGFTCEDWRGLFKNAANTAINTRKDLESLIDSKSDKDRNSILDQYEKIGISVIEQCYLVYRQYEGKTPTLCFWGKNNGKKLENIYVVTSIKDNCAKDIKTIFRSDTKFKRILGLIWGCGQYGDFFEGVKQSTLYVTPHDKNSLKAIEYYEDKVNTKISESVSMSVYGKMSFANEIKLSLYLQTELENSMIRYENDRSPLNFEDLMQKYVLYRNNRQMQALIRDIDSDGPIGNKYGGSAGRGHNFYISHEKYQDLLEKAEGFLYPGEKEPALNKTGIDEAVRKMTADISTLYQEVTRELVDIDINSNDRSSVSDLSSFYNDLYCLDLLLKMKIAEHYQNFAIASDHSNSISYITEQIPGESYLGYWKKVIDKIWE